MSLILPHALCFDSTDPESKGELFLTYSDLVTMLPIYRLRYRRTRKATSPVAELLQRQILAALAAASRP